MEIATFLSDEKLVKAWLDAEKRALESEGIFFPYWLHQSQPGFGLVIVDEKSGEFHLGKSGETSLHVEQWDREANEFAVLTSMCASTTSLQEFEQQYDLFRQQVVS